MLSPCVSFHQIALVNPTSPKVLLSVWVGYVNGTDVALSKT